MLLPSPSASSLTLCFSLFSHLCFFPHLFLSLFSPLLSSSSSFSFAPSSSTIPLPSPICSFLLFFLPSSPICSFFFFFLPSSPIWSFFFFFFFLPSSPS